MTDFITSLQHTGFTARIKRLADLLGGEARKIYNHLGYDIEPNWHLIFLLLKEQDLSVTEIAETLKFSHPAIIKITQKMSKKGYLKSTQDKEDSRRKILSLSSKSKRLLSKFEKEWHRVSAVVKDCCTSTFLDDLKKFEERLSETSFFDRFVKKQ